MDERQASPCDAPYPRDSMGRPIYPRPRKSIEERFWTKVLLDDSTQCWEWVAAKSPEGYGRFVVDPTLSSLVPTLAHRVSFELIVGPIPDGLTIDHLCRNPSCVNPSHFEPVTMKENILRGNGPPALNHRKTHCVQGHEFTEENTIRRATGRQCRICVDRRRKEYELRNPDRQKDKVHNHRSAVSRYFLR